MASRQPRDAALTLFELPRRQIQFGVRAACSGTEWEPVVIVLIDQIGNDIASADRNRLAETSAPNLGDVLQGEKPH
jgi:hypothetical protein